LHQLKSKISEIKDEKIVLFERTPVRWNGRWLTLQDYLDARTCVLNLNITTHGYDCRACDPLLLTTAAVFRIQIVHEMIGNTMVYDCAASRRIVHLSSNNSHMVHERNVERNELLLSNSKQDFEEKIREAEDAICGTCGMLFSSKNNMLRHQHTKHHFSA